jgi:hypothetical protein
MARNSAAALAHSSVHQGAVRAPFREGRPAALAADIKRFTSLEASSSSSNRDESARGIYAAPSSTISTKRLSSSSIITRIRPSYIGTGFISGRVSLSIK